MPKRKAKKVTSSSADENSVKPRKTRTNTPKTSDSPPKTPRTHPSLPLQMTTRGASRRASASQSESGHSLISDRRASLDMAVSDAETDKAANAVRLSTEGPQEPGATTTDSSLTERDTPAEQSSDAAPSNKRKRAENPEADASENPDLSIAAPEAEADTEKLPTISVEPVAKKRRGRQPKPPTSPSAAPVTADDGLLDVPQPIVKRGPGRPRGSKKPAGKLTGLSGPRGPGRKRAPHSDPRIEALLVRQGDLRKSYRQVAKAIKPALAELADRCTQDLLEQEEVHKKALEYDVVQKELDVRLDQALAVTERRYQLDRENMMSILEADKVVARKDYTRKVRDLQDDQLAHCKHAFMEVVRSMRIATDEDATDDEDADAGRPRRPDEPFPGTSRSWFFRDVDRRWAELEKQAHMLRSLYACAPSIVLEPLRNLATIDAQQRHVAVAANNVEMLRLAAEAADVTSVARESNPLDLLASAAEDTGARVNKRAVPQTPKTPKRQARPKMGLFLSPAKGRDRAPENGVTASPTTRFEGTSSLSAILNQDEPPPRRPTIVTTQTYGTAAASVKTEESPRRGIMDHRMRAGQVEVTPGSDKKHPPLGSWSVGKSNRSGYDGHMIQPDGGRRRGSSISGGNVLTAPNLQPGYSSAPYTSPYQQRSGANHGQISPYSTWTTPRPNYPHQMAVGSGPTAYTHGLQHLSATHGQTPVYHTSPTYHGPGPRLGPSPFPPYYDNRPKVLTYSQPPPSLLPHHPPSPAARPPQPPVATFLPPPPPVMSASPARPAYSFQPYDPTGNHSQPRP